MQVTRNTQLKASWRSGDAADCKSVQKSSDFKASQLGKPQNTPKTGRELLDGGAS